MPGWSANRKLADFLPISASPVMRLELDFSLGECVGGDNRPTLQNWLLAETLIWRGDQRCSIILQLGFLLFVKVSPAHNNALTSSGGRWNSFGQSIATPGASLGQKAARVAEIATRVTESLERPTVISAKLGQHHLRRAQYFTQH
jgi:hypothetical protein